MNLRTIHPARPLSRARRSRRSRCAFTTIELLIALGITAVVGLGIASMLLATTTATDPKNDLRALVARHKVLDARLTHAVAGSKAVLAHGLDYLVLWIGDTRADGVPNLSELQRIEWDSDTGEVASYAGAFPANFSQAQRDAADTAYTLADNFNAITTNLKSGSYFPGTKWASDVTAWSTTLDNVSPQAATLVSYRLTLRAGQHAETAVGAVALRR